MNGYLKLKKYNYELLKLHNYLNKKRSSFVHLVWFYGTSTIVGHLMPNPFLYTLAVLFQSTQFSSILPIARNLSTTKKTYFGIK